MYFYLRDDFQKHVSIFVAENNTKGLNFFFLPYSSLQHQFLANGPQQSAGYNLVYILPKLFCSCQNIFWLFFLLDRFGIRLFSICEDDRELCFKWALLYTNPSIL
jgi:hypothetical protein